MRTYSPVSPPRSPSPIMVSPPTGSPCYSPPQSPSPPPDPPRSPSPVPSDGVVEIPSPRSDIAVVGTMISDLDWVNFLKAHAATPGYLPPLPPTPSDKEQPDNRIQSASSHQAPTDEFNGLCPAREMVPDDFPHLMAPYYPPVCQADFEGKSSRPVTPYYDPSSPPHFAVSPLRTLEDTMPIPSSMDFTPAAHPADSVQHLREVTRILPHRSDSLIESRDDLGDFEVREGRSLSRSSNRSIPLPRSRRQSFSPPRSSVGPPLPESEVSGSRPVSRLHSWRSQSLYYAKYGATRTRMGSARTGSRSRSRSSSPRCFSPTRRSESYIQYEERRSRSRSPVHLTWQHISQPIVICAPSPGPPTIVHPISRSRSRTPPSWRDLPTVGRVASRSRSRTPSPGPPIIIRTSSPRSRSITPPPSWRDHREPTIVVRVHSRSRSGTPSPSRSRTYSPPYHSYHTLENLYSGSVGEVIRSNRYWFDDGSVIVVVGTVMYKLHRSVLEKHSPVLRRRFRHMPNLLQSRSCVYRHTLEEVSFVDFDRLLTFMYPQDFMERESWTSTEWSSILAIATKLEIHTLRQVAIKRLSQVGSDVDRIVFGRLHNVKEWLGPAHLALCNRDQPLTVDEVLRLDKLTLHGIMVARESRYGHQLPGMTRKLTLDDIGKTFDDIV